MLSLRRVFNNTNTLITMKRYFNVVLFSCLLLSCTAKDIVPESSRAQNLSETRDRPLTFSSKEDLDRFLTDSAECCHSGLRSTLSENNNMDFYEDPFIGTIFISDLVPEEPFSSILSTKGEIIVADTLYRITTKGTFFTPIEKASLIEDLSGYDFTKEVLRGRDLYEYKGVFRYDTFKGVDFTAPFEVSSEEEHTNLRSNIPEPNIASFEKRNAYNPSIVGGFLQRFASLRKPLVKNFPGRSNRRINCALFDYNYIVRQSIGISVKVQKKLWYGGWGRMVNWPANTIRAGFKNVVIKFPYPSDSTYDVILKRAFPGGIPPGGILSLRSPNGWTHADQSAKYRVDLNYPPITNSSSLSLDKIIQLTGKHVYTLVRGRINAMDNRIKLSDLDDFERNPRSQRPKDLEEILAKLKLSVPVFAKDGIYVFIPHGVVLNRENESEVKVRFVNAFGRFTVGYSATLGDKGPGMKSVFQNILKQSKIINKDAALIAGEFYGCAYLNSWIGYRMYWN